MSGQYFAPSTLPEALELLASMPGARILAGGTDLLVSARKQRQPLPEKLISIHTISGLRQIDVVAKRVRIGALASHSSLEAHRTVVSRLTALADAAALVGSPATRHVGTVGGNLSNASPANEMGSPLLVFGAVIEVQSRVRTREVAVNDFFLGPGRTALQEDELVTAISVPLPDSLTGSAYLRLESRRAMEIAIVGAAASISLTPSGRIAETKIALTAVAPSCLLVPSVDQTLIGAEPNRVAFEAAAAVASKAARPIDDVRATAAYRRAMIRVVVRRALEIAARRARAEETPVPANDLFWQNTA